MPSSFTTNISLEQPTNGSDVGTWDVPVNGNSGIIDQVIGSSTTVAFTNANVTLTVAQSAYFTIICTGTLSANVKLILPGTIGGRRNIFNQTTGAFTLTVLNGSGDTGGGVQVGQGFITPVVLTAGQAYYDAYASTPPGTIVDTAFTNPPPGFLLCYGQNVSRTTYAQLWAAAQQFGWTWGTGDGSTTFTLPDARGILRAGADNMGGTPANRLTGYTVGTTGGSQAVSLIASQLPVSAYQDSGHTHTKTDPGHNHQFGNNIQVGVFASNGGGTDYLIIGSSAGLTTSNSTTGITINSGTANISNPGGGQSHSNVQPTMAVNVMIRY